MGHVEVGCRSCGQKRLTPILTLGRLPLANKLLNDDELSRAEPRYPLELMLCPRCSLVQVNEAVPPEELSFNYVHFTSQSEHLVRHARQLTSQVMATQRLRPTSLVIEVASNDGYLLKNYLLAGIPVLGIEPAIQVAKVARDENSVPTLCKYFGRDLAAQLEACGQQADVVHVHNVMAHVADLNGFVAGMRTVLKPTGVAVIEVPYVKDLVDKAEFDAIYHEHLCYFSLTALVQLFSRHGLIVHDCERMAIQGGSLRLFVGRRGITSARVRKMLDEEAAWGVSRAPFYLTVAARIEKLRNDLVTLLTKLKSEGRRIAVYGASAQGSTFLNYCQIGHETVDFVVDRNTCKQGRYTPGSHLKIHSPDKLALDKPDYVLLLSWNQADEILAQQTAFRQTGGQFIIPLPSVKVA